MNGVRAAMTMNPSGGGGGAVSTNNVVPNPTISTKAVTPRMILGPQVIGARPGPGVFEYTSEFSEFLKKSAHATREAAITIATPPPEPEPEPSPPAGPSDDAHVNDVAQCQDSILNLPSTAPSPPAESSSWVHDQSITNQSESDNQLPSLPRQISHPSSPAHSPSPTNHLLTPDLGDSSQGQRSQSPPNACQALHSSPPSSAATVSDIHSHIMIFPKVSSNSPCASPRPIVAVVPTTVSECAIEKALESDSDGEDILKEKESLIHSNQSENKEEESCDRSLQLQPSEQQSSAALLVPFEEQLLDKPNPSPDLELIRHTPEPEVVFANEATECQAFTSSFRAEGLDESRDQYASSTVQFSPKPESSSFGMADFSPKPDSTVSIEIPAAENTPPVISYSRSIPTISPILAEIQISETLRPQQQEVTSQLQIQILPYSKPSTEMPPFYENATQGLTQHNFNSHSNFNSKVEPPLNTYGVLSVNRGHTAGAVVACNPSANPGANHFSPTSDFNYNHLMSFSEQNQRSEVQPPPFFTTDPGLHSQFLEYAESHPLGEKPKVRNLQSEMTVNKSAPFSHSPVMSSPGSYYQPRRNSIPENGSGSYAPPLVPNQYGTRLPEPRPPNYSTQLNSSCGGGPPPMSPFLPPDTMKHPQPQPTSPYHVPHQQQMRHSNIPHVQPMGRSQFDSQHYPHGVHNYRPPHGQPPQTQLSPRLNSPTSPIYRAGPPVPWIHATQHGSNPITRTPHGPIQASILPSPNMEAQNRMTTDYYARSSCTTQSPVQIRPMLDSASMYQGPQPSLNNLRKPLTYGPNSTSQYEPYDKGGHPVMGNKYPPTSSQMNYHVSPGIPSHSTVVGQIPPILGGVSGQGIRPSHANHHSSSSLAHHTPSPYAQHHGSQYPRDTHPSSYSSSTRGGSSQGYYAANQSRYPGVGDAGGQGQYASSGMGGGYPVVCRVTPIRSRLEHGAGRSDERGYAPTPAFPKSPFNSPSSRMPPSFAPDQRPPHLRGAEGSVSQHRLEYDSYNSYSCQYSDAMWRLSTQFTLQALPGLPPGAQGHHLLVKTENGQYQLIRVGPPPTPAATSPAPGTAASGTPTVPQSSQSHAPPTTLGGPVTTSMVVQLPHSSSPTTLTPPPGPTTSSTSAKTTFVVMNAPAAAGGVVGSSAVLTNSTPKPTPPSVPVTPPHVVIAPPTTSLPASSSLSMTTSSSSNTNHSSSSSTLNPNVSSRLQTPSVPPAPASNSPSGVGMTASMSMQHQMHPHPVVLPLPQPQAMPSHLPSSVLTSITASSTIAATATTVSQMTPDTAKQKCKNFLSFLLELSAKQNQTVARNVRSLIQGLVDGKVNAEDFSDRLQKEVNSQPQPCLVGFLKKSLPPLRQSLANKELTIDGIRPPPISSLTTIVPPTQPIISTQIRPPLPIPTTPVRIITPINTSTNLFPSASPVIPSTTPIPRSTVAAVQQRFAALPKSSPKSKGAKATEGSPLTPKSSGSKGKEKVDKKSFASSGTFGGDDDINDVAAMGGVNLAEESQRILGSTELIGTQIRSCQDEPFIKGSSLQGRIRMLAAHHGLDEPPPEVAVMISHAAEEHIKTMLEKLALIAEHRLDVIKLDERYEVTQDVKGQLRFLEELEKLERKRHDEQEREMLIKAAKSRSKSEDPEQAKLKAKAKEMQRVAQEELRQREANLTALQAIGPRKKPKLDIPTGSQSTIAQSPAVGLGALSNASRPHIPMRPRLKRVSMRDVLFLLESEGEMRRSDFLYKQFLK